ncbi:conserved hypothetical protein [Heliomicrobium modesticaldum Ice1]|uniref:D-erythronate kinase n=1 Tax=Heliobacterium modesticaldum (strain ATCC 51547 / Ice1) TaxID=498761 RepID=DENK_HELMI|nr:D-erythronate kinase [Heliomicrobium modesticaldum]B0TBI9.1 RecName: Full=D-erythronate kinase [Heliomicrobium modesticaldum Ice1]ABZ85202.1 conserved hypothetical protein [Heliomicrobium modesticaldum Ice1]
MSNVVIIADDLTGANATGVLLARKGYKTATFLQLPQDPLENGNRFDVISITTDSRAVAPEEAYRRVAEAARAMLGNKPGLFTKRIDSTLRGNLGPEIDAMLDVLGPDSLAVVVAAFPTSGRITVGGYLLVHSIPLEQTDVARDPKTPVHQTLVADIVAAQSKHSVGFIPLATVLQGSTAVMEALGAQKEAGKRIVVMDAATQKDLDTIAHGAYLSGLSVVAVDPGPFTEALAAYVLPKPKQGRGKKVLMVVGSVTALTRQQLKAVENAYSTCFTTVDVHALIDPWRNAEEIERVSGEVLDHLDDHQVLGVRTVEEAGQVLDLASVALAYMISEEEIASRIADGLAAIARRVLQVSHGEVGGLYTSGGDVTVAVCQALAASGVEVKDEVVPLAAYGRLIGGAFHQTPIITKGGLVGNSDAACTCVDYLLTKISNETYPAE